MGKKKDKSDKPFFQKMRFRYRISVMDENSLEEKTFFRLSRFSVFLYLCSFVVITFAILTVLIFTTPIRYYLPGYGDEGNREMVIAESMRADSLQKQMNLQMEYLTIVKNIIAGDIEPTEVVPLDSFVFLDKQNAASLLNKSQREIDFVNRFEEEEKYNLSTIQARSNDNTFVFFPPVSGVISEKYNAAEQRYGISFVTSSNQNVLSVLDGTVVYADYSFQWGWIIQVQHERNYLSVYKNNVRLLKKVGDIVRAGESIAITGSSQKDDKDKNFYFELWSQGNAVNPEDVIIF
ncbi:M23 family peptidase [Paludibacter sp. 221]|uniref:murein hydrolase activator EnvC family protein n=1 Tax=Paludibacter sp. 221 TaxID=2302939 RepID=UPI0013D3E7A3|nr:M23 family metallopeptidase [Paludibacter sp. 221]NDV46702.1 M23 family peptidase [Paludibacter sp. 221]